MKQNKSTDPQYELLNGFDGAWMQRVANASAYLLVKIGFWERETA